MIMDEKIREVALNSNQAEEYELIEISEGIRLHYFIENRFSTNFISVVWSVPAQRKTATKIALLAECLKLGKSGDRAALDKMLSQMYGANFDASIIQKGGIQLLALNMECVTDKAAGEKLFKHAVDLVKSMMDEKISEKTLNTAKIRLKTAIEQKEDSTAQVAVERLIDVVYSEDALSVHCDGYIEDIQEISLSDINAAFSNLKSKSPMNIFISGEIERDIALKTAKSFISRREEFLPLPEDEQKISAGSAEKSEERSIGQSRIAVAYKTSLSPFGKDWCVAMVLKEVLCGAGGSVLYNNIRQKEGLCYYIGGRILRFRMMFIIDAGVGKGSEEHTASLIEESIKNCKIEQEQFAKAKKAVLRDEKFTYDRRTGKINEAINNMLLGITEEPQIEKDMDSVTISDVQEALSGLVRKGVFILYAEKEEN